MDLQLSLNFHKQLKPANCRWLRFQAAAKFAARGFHLARLPIVVNDALPRSSSAENMHRIGRSGKAGWPALALFFITREENDARRQIETLIGVTIAGEPDVGCNAIENSGWGAMARNDVVGNI